MTKLFAPSDVPQNMDQGPLASIGTAYAALLSQQGFTRQYARLQLRFVGDLNQWLLQHRLQIIDLSETRLQHPMPIRTRVSKMTSIDTSLENVGCPWPPASTTALLFTGFYQINLVTNLFASLT
jgi:hypothetical protein